MYPLTSPRFFLCEFDPTRHLCDPYFDGTEAELMLQEAMATLPDVQRTVFQLRYYEDMKYSEMSRPSATSKSSPLRKQGNGKRRLALLKPVGRRYHPIVIGLCTPIV